MSDLSTVKIKEAIKATEYKYFGDYEFSDNQRESVDTLVSAANELINTRADGWISVDKFKTDKDILVHAYCNDIVNGWVEHLIFTPDNELFFPHGTRYPAMVTHVAPIALPTPPTADKEG